MLAIDFPSDPITAPLVVLYITIYSGNSCNKLSQYISLMLDLESNDNMYK